MSTVPFMDPVPYWISKAAPVAVHVDDFLQSNYKIHISFWLFKLSYSVVHSAGNISERAVGAWHPQVGRSSIKQNLEVLWWGSNSDRSEVLSVGVVGESLVEGIVAWNVSLDVFGLQVLLDGSELVLLTSISALLELHSEKVKLGKLRILIEIKPLDGSSHSYKSQEKENASGHAWVQLCVITNQIRQPGFFYKRCNIWWYNCTSRPFCVIIKIWKRNWQSWNSRVRPLHCV